MKISVEGRNWLREEMQRKNYFNKKEVLTQVKDPINFKEMVIGLEVENVINKNTHYSVMLIEGVVWEKGNPDPYCMTSPQAIHDEAILSFKQFGVNNLFFLYPKLKEYVDGVEVPSSLGAGILGMKVTKIKFKNKDVV